MLLIHNACRPYNAILLGRNKDGYRDCSAFQLQTAAIPRKKYSMDRYLLMHAIVPYLIIVRRNLCQVGKSNACPSSPDPGVERRAIVSRVILMVSIEQNSAF
jgi:hypothetical protein